MRICLAVASSVEVHEYAMPGRRAANAELQSQEEDDSVLSTYL